MRWFHRDAEPDPWGTDAVDVTCVRVVVDARAERYLAGEAARITPPGGDDPAARAATLRAASMLLRHLYPAWLGAGLATGVGFSVPAARAQLDAWRAPLAAATAASAGRGTAILASLLVAGRGPLVVPSASVHLEDVRGALEGLTIPLPIELLAVELVVGAERIDPARIPATMWDPPVAIERPPWPDQPFCRACGLPLTTELERCPACATPVDRPTREWPVADRP